MLLDDSESTLIGFIITNKILSSSLFNSVTVSLFDHCFQVRIGPNTSIGAEQFGHMKWTDAKKAAKDLLVAVFGRATLATHCYTGTSSNAFKDKEAKPQLEAQKVSDIIGE